MSFDTFKQSLNTYLFGDLSVIVTLSNLYAIYKKLVYMYVYVYILSIL